MATRLLRDISALTRPYTTPDQPVTMDRLGKVYLPELRVDGSGVRVDRLINWGDGWRSLGDFVWEHGVLRKDKLAGPHCALVSLRVYDIDTDLPLRPLMCRYVITPLDGATPVGVTCVDWGEERDPMEPLVPRQHSIAAVQEVDEANTTAQVDDTLAFGSNVTAGNAITAQTACFNDTQDADLDLLTDSLSHTYTALLTEQELQTSQISSRGYFVLNISGGACTITRSTNDAGTDNYYTGAQQEWSGMATTGALDDSDGLGGTGTAVSAGDSTPTEDNELKISWMTYDGAATTLVAEAGWTEPTNLPNNNIYQALGVLYKIDTTAVTEDADWTLGASRGWNAAIASFKAAAGAAAKRRYTLPTLGVG